MATERKSKPAEHSSVQSAFVMPSSYTDRTLPRLRDDFAGEWWLNVDYVSGGFGFRKDKKH